MPQNKSILLLAFLLTVGQCGPVGAQVPAAKAPTAAKSRETADYILGPDDVIEVAVLGRTDFTTRGRIGEDGTMRLPYLGTVQVSNTTGKALEDRLGQALQTGGFYARPIVRVEIVSYASRYVVVLGNVVTPGLVPIDRPYHLSEIIARAGGAKEGAADYVILRPAGGAERKVRIADLATGSDEQDPMVVAGEKIYLPNADFFYVSGQVKTPGTYALVGDMTVGMAIAKGGGLTDNGSDKHIQVTRNGSKLPHVTLDMKLQPGDIVLAGEGLF